MNSLFASIGPKLVELAIRQRASYAKQNVMLNDGQLHVILVGTGSPITDLNRAGPCAVVIAGSEYLVVDVGQGSFAKISTIDPNFVQSISGILLTHFHSDHITQLGEYCTMTWAASGRRSKMPVYGPPGVKKVVSGFHAAYEEDSKYRRDHHHNPPLVIMESDYAFGDPIEIPVPGGSHDSLESEVVFERNGLKVIAFNVDHKPVIPAFGYSFEYRGRVVVISRDTAKCKQLVKFSRGADILISEASSCFALDGMIQGLTSTGQSRLAKLMDDIKDYHIDVQDAANIASKNKIPILALTHIVPGTQGSWLFLRMWLAKFIRPKEWKGELIVGNDGDSFHLPSTPSKKIERRNLLDSNVARLSKNVNLVVIGLFIALLSWIFMYVL